MKRYDRVFIGTSMICMLEAVFQSLAGKSVLMIDDQDDIGGAWKPLQLFGAHEVENAIHYFLPDARGLRFMRETLGWRVTETRSKFRVFDPPVWGIRHLAYDHAFAPFLASVSLGAPWRQRGQDFLRGLGDLFIGGAARSHYVEGGCAEMLGKIRSLVESSSVELRLSTVIEEIYVDPVQGVRVVVAGGGAIQAEEITFTHGSKVKLLRGPHGPLPVQLKKHLRPAVHLFLADSTPTKILEVIFTGDNLVKYAHDITRYARENQQLQGKKKIFVLALHPHITAYDGLYRDLLAKLQKAGALGPEAVLEAHYWWDIFLPSLEDADLERIRRELGERVTFLKTENFARGIGLCADRWSTRIPPHNKGATA